MTIAPSDNRTPLTQLLKLYSPVNPEDQSQRDCILTFVETEPQCFERSHLAGHITGSAWVMNKTGTQVLLTHHKKLNKWLQLGGHADGQSDIQSVALREAQEESGIEELQSLSPNIFDLDVHPIPERPHEPAHLHYDIRFLFQTKGSEVFKVGHESNQLAWVNVEEIASLSKEESLLRMARKWKAFE